MSTAVHYAENYSTNLSDNKFKLILDDSHCLFHPTCQNGFITNPFLDSPLKNVTNQAKPQQHVTLNEKGRDAYFKASLALLANATSQSGIIGTSNSIEIAFLQIVHYIVIYGVDPAKASLKKIIESVSLFLAVRRKRMVCNPKYFYV